MNRMRSTCAVVMLMLLASTIARAQQSDASRKALESAAAKGSAPAQYALGAAAEADGDFGHALDWYQRAADQNYAPALFKIGGLYETGKGVDADKGQAVEWYRKASAQGLAQATERLQALDPSAVASPTPAASAPAESATPAAPVEQPQPLTQTTESPRPSMPIAVAPPSVTPAASPAPGTVTGFAAFDRLPKDTQNTIILVYVGISTFFGWLMMRPIVMRWYRSNTFFVSGGSAGQILGNQIQLRLQTEGLALTFGAIVGCLGGNLWFILSRAVRLFVRRKDVPAEHAEIA